MRRALLFTLLILLTCLAAQARKKPGTQPKGEASPQAKSAASAQGGNAALQKVLDAMDRAATGFQSAQADFVWDQFQSVVNDHDLQKGVMYIRRNGNDMEMAADINDPADQKKYVLYTGGKVQLYQPKIDQITQYSAGKNKEAFESFLVLGFGGRGHDLAKQFEVKYLGTENVQGVDAAKLELTPKAPRVKNMFNPILLWIDPARGVSVQQEFMEPGSGNYRLAKYTAIKLNQKINPDVFRIKKTDKTTVVTPGL